MAQKAEGLAMGIDLGTTYSCVGVWLSNRVEIIPNEMGNKKTPSYVAFSDTHLVGEEAKSRASFNLTNTIFNIKRLIGRRSNDNLPIVHIKKFWPFKVEFNPKNHRYMVRVNYKGKEKLFSPEEISSMVLRKMREIAEAHLGTTVKNAVISVPAHFNTSQRQATFDAGVIAGLNVMRLINEPSAAALAYGFDRNVGWMGMKNILVFDLGGGTLDVSLLNIHQGTFKVVSTAGDTYLGGEDFEDAMVNHFIDEFKKKHKQDISSSYKAIRRLKAACEKAKNVLTMTEQATIDIDCLYEEFDFFSTISRTEFEKLNSHLMIKCKEVVKRCLGDVTSDSIDEVLLVGGSSRIRMVQEMLRGFFFGKKLCKAVNADEAVAYGATLQAAMLTCHNGNEEVPKLVLHDVVPLDLSTSINGTYKKTLYQKNTIQPMGDKKLLHLQQYWIHSLDVYEGDQLLRSLILDCDHQLRFVIDENGIWHAWKLVANTEQENEVAIVEGQLSKEEKWKMVEEAKAYNFQDKVHKKNVESKNSLEKFVYDVKKAINDKKMEGKLDAANKEKIEAAVEKVIKWLASVPLIEEKEYKEKMLELQSICHPILSNSQSWR